MKRRELILLLGGASSGAMSVGTGAFSSVEAERNVEVDVVEDENAYLGLEQVADSLPKDESKTIVRIRNQFASPLDLSVTLKQPEHGVDTVTIGGHALNPGDGVNFTLDPPGDAVDISVTCDEPGDTSFELQFYGRTGEASVDKVREFEINCKEPEDNSRNGGDIGTNSGNGRNSGTNNGNGGNGDSNNGNGGNGDSNNGNGGNSGTNNGNGGNSGTNNGNGGNSGTNNGNSGNGDSNNGNGGE